MKPAYEQTGIYIESKIARREFADDVFRGKPGKRKIDRFPGGEIIKTVPSKAISPVALPYCFFTCFDIQVGNIHLQSILLFGEQKHTPALKDILAQMVVQHGYNGSFGLGEIAGDGIPQLFQRCLQL